MGMMGWLLSEDPYYYLEVQYGQIVVRYGQIVVRYGLADYS